METIALGYTLRLTDRAILIDDETGAVISEALLGGKPAIEVTLHLEGEEAPPHVVLLNTAHIIGLIHHREASRKLDNVLNMFSRA